MHTQAMEGRVGLAMKGLNYTALCHRFCLVYNFYNHLGVIKTNLIIYSWFKRAYKPLVPSNSLRLYKFIYNLAPRFFYDKESLLNQILSLNNQDIWQQEGSVILSIFGW